jgi:iron complex outermembrane receptor protein
VSNKILTLLAAGCLSAAAAGVYAQTAPTGASGDELQEIIVTTTRRAESVQSVPLSITALSGDDLANTGATQTRDLVSLAPNLSEQGSFGRLGPSFFIRGIGTTQFNPNANSKVGVYLDEVYLNSPAVQGSQLFDIDRVEIARGPQGYLFGQNTTGGLVRVITNRPKVGGGFTADSEVTAGSYGQLDPQLEVGFETGPNSAARLSFLDQNRDGIQRNTFLGTRDGRTDVYAWRAQWLWKSLTDADLLLAVHGSRDRSDLVPYKQVGLINPATGGPCPAPAPGSGCTDSFGYADSADCPQGEWPFPHQHAWVDSLGVSATLNWHLAAATLTSATAFERNTSRILEDTDASPNDVLNGSYYGRPRQISQELRLTSPEQRLRWIGGLYYFHEDLDSSVAFAAPGFGPSVFTGTSGMLEGLGQLSSMKTDSYAGFGNVEFALTKQLELSLGLRYTHEVKEVLYRAFIDDVGSFAPTTFIAGSLISGNALVQTINFARDKDWNNVSGHASISYTVTDGVLAYLSFARGFNSGNYNGGAFFDQSEATLVNPEILKSYELGLKTELGGHLRFNIDSYWYDFKDMQVFILASGAGGSPIQQLSNAASARLYGSELELAWKPLHSFTAQLGAGYTHSRFANFNSALGGDLTGKTLPSAPKFNLNALLKYEVSWSRGITAFEINDKYQSKQFFSVNNDPLLTQPGYAITDARIAFTTLDERASVTLWGRNIANKGYLVGAYDLKAFGWDQWVVGDPRTWGVSVQYRIR